VPIFSDSVGRALPVIILAALAAALLSYVLTPAIRRFVKRRGMLDHPEARRVNVRPVPRGGGVAVVVAFVVVGIALIVFERSIAGMPSHHGATELQLVALFGGGILAAIIGWLDDMLDLQARWQLLGQLLLAAVAVALGISVRVLSNPFGPGVIGFLAPFGAAFTVVWIVGMINSINFIDGLDGLSTGIALIAAATLGVLSLTSQVDQPFVAVLCFVLAGGLLGFLRWNFQPASIFQGTAGVMFMGYTLAVLSILGTAKVAVALLVLGVPVIDTFWVIVRRIAAGRSPFSADRGHLHHRLLDLGLSHRGTVVLIYLICAALGILSLVVSTATQIYAFLGALVGLGVLVSLLAQSPHDALESTTYEDEGG
jgi:UDP-GlcNAc:undecaprenyl-phosphate GlcNAc-1-phosphate transferase